MSKSNAEAQVIDKDFGLEDLSYIITGLKTREALSKMVDLKAFPYVKIWSGICKNDKNYCTESSIRNALIMLVSYKYFCDIQYGRGNKEKYLNKINLILPQYGFSTLKKGNLYDNIFLMCLDSDYPLNALHLICRELGEEVFE